MERDRGNGLGNGEEERHCGSCTLCCKLIGVHELAKPERVWCIHCDRSRGCRIYEDRPESCRTFACLWLQSGRRPANQKLPDALRPDRCRAVLTPGDDGRGMIVHVDAGFSDAHRKGALRDHLQLAVAQGVRVIVSVGRRHLLLSGAREIELDASSANSG